MTALVWRSVLSAEDVAEVLALIDAATVADGTAPVSEHVLLHLRHGGDPLGRHLLARATDPDVGSDGELVGYAQIDLADPADSASELVVHPKARNLGIGSTLVAALLERAGTRRLRLWAHGEHPGAVRLARRMGFREVRTLWQMRRDLTTPLDGPELPPGVRLRPFVVGQDEAEFLRVNNAAFGWHPEQGGWDVEQLKRREAEPWFDPAGFLLAVTDPTDAAADGTAADGAVADGGERLLGFHWTKVHEGAPGDPATGGHRREPIGEVYVLGVDPAARGRHLGAALTVAGLRYLRDLGLREVMLYVESDNDAAVAVYRTLGFTRWHTDVAFLH